MAGFVNALLAAVLGTSWRDSFAGSMVYDSLEKGAVRLGLFGGYSRPQGKDRPTSAKPFEDEQKQKRNDDPRLERTGPTGRSAAAMERLHKEYPKADFSELNRLADGIAGLEPEPKSADFWRRMLADLGRHIDDKFEPPSAGQQKQRVQNWLTGLPEEQKSALLALYLDMNVSCILPLCELRGKRLDDAMRRMTESTQPKRDYL
jgi:hypothetical protein